MDPPTPSTACHCDSLRRWAHRHRGARALARHTHLRVTSSAKWTLTAQQLAASVRNGCPTCIVISKSVEAFHPGLARVKAIELRISLATPQLRITVEGFRERDVEYDTDFFLSLPAGYQGHNPFPPGILRSPHQPRTASLATNTDEAIDRIKSWIMSCIQGHPTCELGGFVPRRLLNVGSGSPIDADIRLIETRPNMAAPFITLSHCWGQTQHCLTTKANYQQRQEGIPLLGLCKTFQDAVWLTRRLGIRYLWIDSLCIVQDDMDDWDREAVTMFRLYSSAYLTIAAAHGADGDAGILYEDASASQHTLQVDLPAENEDASTVTVVLTPRVRRDRKSDVHSLYGNVRGRALHPTEPLLGRGWAFQERALSTRIVHFTSEELVWECKEKRRCECGSITQDQESFATALTTLMGSRPGRLLTSDDDTNEYSVEANGYSMVSRELPSYSRPPELPQHIIMRNRTKMWWEFVGVYTALQLTKPTDRGPAFAGIAQSFGTIAAIEDGETLGRYCAGLWQRHLPYSLFWTCTVGLSLQPPVWDDTSPRRIRDAMAPSWSWYSVAGQCRHLDMEAEAPLNVWYSFQGLFDDDDLEVGYEFVPATTGGTAFGRLARGELVFEGMPVVVASRQASSGSFIPQAVSGESLSGFCEVILLADDPDDSRMQGEITCLPLYKGDHRLRITTQRRIPRRQWPQNGPHEDGYDADAFYALEHEDDDFGGYSPYEGLNLCDEHVFGISLVAVPSEDGVYRRIGLFHAEGAGCLADIGQSKLSTVKFEERPPSSGFEQEWSQCIQLRDKIRLV